MSIFAFKFGLVVQIYNIYVQNILFVQAHGTHKLSRRVIYIITVYLW